MADAPVNLEAGFAEFAHDANEKSLPMYRMMYFGGALTALVIVMESQPPGPLPLALLALIERMCDECIKAVDDVGRATGRVSPFKPRVH